MPSFQFQLQRYAGIKTRHACPDCDKPHQFSLYIDLGTGDALNDSVGKCNREDKCGYHYTPRQYFQDHPELNEEKVESQGETAQTAHHKKGDAARITYKPGNIKREPTFHPFALVEGSMKGLECNCLLAFLRGLYGAEAVLNAAARYRVGSSKKWPGASVFWQIDAEGNVRGGKVMLFNPQTSRRIKEPFPHITWVHKILKLQDFELRQCLFGEHLLKEHPGLPVAVVEAEKTALVGSLGLPQFLWLSVGSLTSLSEARCQALKGREVVLFPDLGAFDKWSEKAKGLSHIASFTVCDYLERNAPEEEREEGFDIADYLIRFALQSDGDAATAPDTSAPIDCPMLEAATPLQPAAPEFSGTVKKDEWSLQELEQFFATKSLPNGPVKLSPGVTVIESKLFIEASLCLLKANNGNKSFLPYLLRLNVLRQKLENLP